MGSPAPAPSAPYESRLARLRAALQAAGQDGCLIGPSSDLLYLTGLDLHPSERLALLIVGATGPSHLVVPAFEAAGLPALPPGVAAAPWEESADPAAQVAALLAGRAAHLVVSDRLWAGFLLRIQAALPGATFAPAAPILGPLRLIKDAAEVAALAEAGARADATFAEIRELPFAGRSERQVAEAIAGLLRRRGLLIEWGPIVGSGPNGASPHHTAGERVIADGDLVVLDYGGRLAGYQADMTRTVAVGHAPEGEARQVYDLVYAGQELGVRAAQPGMTGAALDSTVRDYFTAAGYGAYFTHRLGHGIGLDGHEPPYLVQGGETVLAPGMAFSIEPGLYLPGRFGVRIEDIVVLTANGAQRLNDAPRELVVVH